MTVETTPTVAPQQPMALQPLPPLPPGNGLPSLRSGIPGFPAPIEQGPPRAKPPEDSWEAVTPVARAGSIGRLGGAITQALNELKPALDDCFSAASQARNAGQAVTEVKDEVVAEGDVATTLMLQVEGLAGQVRIVDAPVEMRGTASDGLIACAQGILRGQVIPAAAVKPGTRYRMPLPARAVKRRRAAPARRRPSLSICRSVGSTARRGSCASSPSPRAS